MFRFATCIIATIQFTVLEKKHWRVLAGALFLFP